MVDWLAGKRIKGTSSERTTLQDPILGGTGVGGWVELGRHTLTQAGDTLAVTNLANKRYYMVLIKILHSGAYNPYLRFNNDSGGNYSERWEFNGSEGTSINQTELHSNFGGSAEPAFTVLHITNFSGKQKYVLRDMVYGSNTTIFRGRSSGKWANLNDTISSIGLYNSGNGDFSIGSEMVVLGYDPADTHTTNFWQELHSDSQTGQTVDNIDSGTFTNKKYLWAQLWVKGTANTTVKCTFNNSTDSTYAYRYSNNGASDTAITSGASNVPLHNTKANATKFINMFIENDGSNEPLVMSFCAEDGGSGATVDPDRRETVFKRSTTTAITDIEFDNDDTGDFTDWEFKIWGSD